MGYMVWGSHVGSPGPRRGKSLSTRETPIETRYYGKRLRVKVLRLDVHEVHEVLVPA